MMMMMMRLSLPLCVVECLILVLVQPVLALAEDGATEEEALLEASLQCSAALGNFEHEDEEGTGESRSVSHTSMHPPVPAVPELRLACLKEFVATQQHLHTDDASPRGIAYSAFVVERALFQWLEEAQLSKDVLEKAYSARTRPGALDYAGKGKNLALVVCQLPWLESKTTSIIHWQIPGRTGRPVDLDSENRVKALVCVGRLREAFNLEDADMIHPDIGVPMLRARGYKQQERPTIHSDILRLRTICNTALQQQTQREREQEQEPSGNAVPALDDDYDDSNGCRLCAELEAVLPELPFQAALPNEPMSQCPCCLQFLS